MTKLLIDSCEVVVTMDDAGTEVSGASILIDEGVISWVGSGEPQPEVVAGADRIDGRGTVALPGLINTHHHLYQTMTRARAQDQPLFGWLRELYPVWAGLNAEWERAAAMVGLAELARSGCTLSTDHHYVFPADAAGLLEAEIDAAREIGLRFHPCRGSMDMGEKQGGLPPDSVIQDTDTVLAETEEAIRTFHDPEPGSMLRIAVAPCSFFTASDRLMRESAELARRLGVRMHTHGGETLDEEEFCAERFGRRPIELLDDVGWLGRDVWLAHCVHLNDADIRLIAQTGTGVASCPSSNLRLASGIARVRDLLDAGATVGLGVDGSASNDASNMIAEVRTCLLAARAGMDPRAMSAREAIRLATRGGAACLGQDGEVGSIEPGKRADIALFSVEGLSFAGAEADPVAALVFSAAHRVRDLFVEGRLVVADGRLATADEAAIAAEGHRIGRALAGSVASRVGVVG
jgi:cytosine/adenosine deaminase-related metal-dependent hydrolase